MKLKVIAEGMGYKAGIEFIATNPPKEKTLWLIKDGKIDFTAPYNPLTNNNQMLEIIELFEWFGIERPMGKDLYIVEYRKSLWDACAKTATGKTLNEAVCNAAYEYFTEDK